MTKVSPIQFLPRTLKPLALKPITRDLPQRLCIYLWLAAENCKALLGSHPSTYIVYRPLWGNKGAGSNDPYFPYQREMRHGAIQLGINVFIPTALCTKHLHTYPVTLPGQGRSAPFHRGEGEALGRSHAQRRQRQMRICPEASQGFSLH